MRFSEFASFFICSLFCLVGRIAASKAGFHHHSHSTREHFGLAEVRQQFLANSRISNKSLYSTSRNLSFDICKQGPISFGLVLISRIRNWRHLRSASTSFIFLAAG